MDKKTSRKLMLQYIREYTNKGQIIDATKTADYSNVHDHFLDTVQKEVALQIKIPAVMKITQNHIQSQLGLLQGFDLQQYLPGKPIAITKTGTKSLFFEMDSIGTVTIAVNGTVTRTINNTTKSEFTEYRLHTGATDTDTVTITFSGNYPYNIRNVAPYAYAFPTDEDIPKYQPYISYDLPEDFYQFDTVVMRSDPRVYRIYNEMKWENNNKVILNYYDVGSFDIHYFRYPKTIPEDAPEDTKLELEEKGALLVPMKLAALVVAEDKPDISNKLLTMYESQLANIANATSQGTQKVETVYYMS
jgi:hypothetical protein